jgi:hypothetical protein
MFTVRRLGVGDRLARTLTSTNPIESMISISRTTARNVKRCAALGGTLSLQVNTSDLQGRYHFDWSNVR